LSFTYGHLNLVIDQYDLNVIYVTGSGHGGRNEGGERRDPRAHAYRAA
jgi:phosphoketolase